MPRSTPVASAALDGVTWLIRLLPVSLMGLAADLLGLLSRPFAGRDLARLRENVHRVYGLPPKTHFSRMFERQVLRHHVSCTMETIRGIYEPKRFVVAGFDELKANVATAEARGKGHILVTAHLGSWELCAFYGQKAAQKPFHVLAKPSRMPALTRWLDALRRRMGVAVLWTDRKSLLRDMLTTLRNGASVGFVMDQKPEGRKGPIVNFFNRPTEFVSGPASVALKTGAAVISIFCLREGPFRFRILSQLLALPEGGGGDEQALTQLMATEIERVIRLYPEQWAWNYKRWRT